MTRRQPAPATTLPPRGTGRIAAEEIARRVRSAYGLPYTLTEPLVAERRFLGALILSRRTREPFADPERRLLGWAAQEVAAAFSRAYALEDAERGANLDALTGLPNRRYFDELLAIMGPRRRDTDSLGILMVDIDHFKRLNDRYGHARVTRCSGRWRLPSPSTLRAEDTPVRYGGEEFAVILRRASAPQASEAAERVRAAVAALPREPARAGRTGDRVGGRGHRGRGRGGERRDRTRGRGALPCQATRARPRGGGRMSPATAPGDATAQLRGG